MPNLVAVQMPNEGVFVISNMTEEEAGTHYSLLSLIKSPQHKMTAKIFSSLWNRGYCCQWLAEENKKPLILYFNTLLNNFNYKGCKQARADYTRLCGVWLRSRNGLIWASQYFQLFNPTCCGNTVPKSTPKSAQMCDNFPNWAVLPHQLKPLGNIHHSPHLNPPQWVLSSATSDKLRGISRETQPWIRAAALQHPAQCPA